MSQVEKKESNQLASMDWNDSGEVLTLKFFDGVTETFKPALTSMGVHAEAKQYGFHVKINRLGAISATEFPTRQARADEYKRRFREFKAHVYTGAESWDLPRAKRETGPSEEDLVEIINRVFAGRGQEMLTKALKKNEGDLPKTKEQIMQVREFARAWVEIQTARRQASLGRLETMAEDFLAGLEG